LLLNPLFIKGFRVGYLQEPFDEAGQHRTHAASLTDTRLRLVRSHKLKDRCQLCGSSHFTAFALCAAEALSLFTRGKAVGTFAEIQNH
jgi:hypothetical protein